MSYVDVEYYTNEYKGTSIPNADLSGALEKASLKIDTLTFNRIVALGFDRLSVFQQRMVKLAVCTQADHMFKTSEFIGLGVKSYSIGDVSMSTEGNLEYSKECIDYLMCTGLSRRTL